MKINKNIFSVSTFGKNFKYDYPNRFLMVISEKYISAVTKSEVKGSGLGTTRTCDVQMGEQSFQLMETLVKLDDSQKSLSIAINNAPLPMKGLIINFSVSGNDNSSELQISTESEQTSENIKIIEGILQMISGGLKQFHEK